MKLLENFDDKCISILHKFKLLRPLLKSSITEDLLSEITIEKELRDKTINKFLEDAGINDKTVYESFLTDNHLTQDDIENKALTPIKLQLYCKENFTNNVESHFISRKDSLDVIVYSLIRVRDFFKAQELYFRIQEKECSFGDIAEKYSEGIEKKTRGVIGPSTLDSAHPKLAEILRVLKPGETHPPIAIENTYIIVRLENYDAAHLDDYMRGKMLQELFYNMVDLRVVELSKKLLSQSLNNKTN
tara:strand:- start:540 stop:1274 length:735 start_codon:yes stop_codon:yes gene_type:complete